MPERQKTVPQEGSPETYDNRLAVLEAWKIEAGDLLKEIHAAVVGGKTGKDPGHAEQIRALDQRLGFLERLVKWAAGVGTAILTALAIAWAAFTAGPRPPVGH